ncbi:MFS transporter [Methanocorpusculum labreanum]|nr:MFS transporter [Methanocorpusculum labreanum]
MQNRTFRPTRWTLVFLLLSSMMILMGGAAVAPALPEISSAFPEASEATIALIISLPALAIACTGFIIGAVVDRLGRIPVLAISLVIFTLAGVSGFFLTTLPAILVGRFILGIGIAGIISSTTSLITDYYNGPCRVRVLGYQAAAMGIGVLILDTSGGLLAGISWRMSFLIYGLGLFILIGTLITMKEPVKQQTEVNRNAPKTKVPVTSIALIYGTLFIGMILFFLMPTKFPYLVSEISGDSAILSGILLGVMGCFSALIGVFYWRIAGKVHRVMTLALSFILLGLGYCLFGISVSLETLITAVMIVGIGNGLLMPTVLGWLGLITPPAVMGKVMGGYGMSLNLGQFVSSFAAVPILLLAASYGHMFLIFGLVSLCIGVVYVVGYLHVRRNPDAA